jgi:septal ring factor EnvC (AmiA/AmiB activator)
MLWFSLMKKTDMINNVQIVTNPIDGVPLMLVKTHEKDSKEARYEYTNLLKEIERLNGVITIKDDKIDALHNDLKESMRKVDELLGYAKSTNEKVKKTKETLDETKATLDDTNDKVSRIMPERVDLSRIPESKRPYIIIMRDTKCADDEWEFYVMRVQKQSIAKSIKKLRETYGNSIKRSYTLDHPNAVLLWEDIKQKFVNYLQFDNKTNWFNLHDITKNDFYNKLNKLDRDRKIL